MRFACGYLPVGYCRDGETYPECLQHLLLAAQTTCLTSSSVISPFILLLMMTPFLTLETASLGFQQGLRTHGSPRVLQAFSVWLGLWRQPTSQTD